MMYSQSTFSALEKQTFCETFKYRLIYVYAIDDKKHAGFPRLKRTIDSVYHALL